jgi:hypothetical protein
MALLSSTGLGLPVAALQHCFVGHVLSKTPSQVALVPHVVPFQPVAQSHFCCTLLHVPCSLHVWPSQKLHFAVLQEPLALGAAPPQAVAALTTGLPSEDLHVTERYCVPPPHVAEHAVHALISHPYVTHARALHDADVAGAAPVQLAAFAAGWLVAPLVHVTVRAFWPTTLSAPVHERLHAPQGPVV